MKCTQVSVYQYMSYLESVNQGWINITITPLVIVSYRYFYITITNEACMITNEN